MVTDIRYRYLEDWEAERLYARHPKLGASPDEYCPTCHKKGIYRYQGKDWPCDCVEQLQLHKHYLAAGIGVRYQRLDWDDLKDEVVFQKVGEYANDPDYLEKGIGLILTGEFGTGKTLAANLCLKEFIRNYGYSCFATTFSEMIELYTAGWYSEDDKTYFNRKVIESQVLLLDDIGREMRRKTRLSETTFDNVLRTRVQQGRATILTTNMDLDELGKGYGGAVLSMLSECSTAIECRGDDYRKTAKAALMAEAAAKEIRPIT